MFGPIITENVISGMTSALTYAGSRSPPVPDFTEEWLETPSAFWLHPEGPLSNTTREEWLIKQFIRMKEKVDRIEARSHYRHNPYYVTTGPDYTWMTPAAILGALALT